MRILITGGSGFIGTNMLEDLRNKNHSLLSLDVVSPRINEHLKYYQNIDITDYRKFRVAVMEFEPTHIVHLAARADLDGNDLDQYAANTEGVGNLIKIISELRSLRRCVFTSTKLVVPNGVVPKNEFDYRPDTLYGQSKVIGEKIIHSKKLNFEWCIVRPSSIWGPWSDVPYNPYGRFFKTVVDGWYFHPGDLDPPRSYGYVGNVIYQINKILIAPKERVRGKVFYLADYEAYHIHSWANLISLKTRGRKVPVLPMSIIRIGAFLGDLLKKVGVKNPPLTSFRLKNMGADTSGLPLEEIRSITGPLPFTIEQGVDETLKWLRLQRMKKL